MTDQPPPGSQPPPGGPPPGGSGPVPGYYPPPAPGGFPPPPSAGAPPPAGAYPSPGYPQPSNPQPSNPQPSNPQPGGYPQQPGYPQPGGYPPAQPGYPTGGGYPPPPPGWSPPPPAFSVGEAFSWAWNKFSKNALVLIVPAVVYALILSVVGALFFVLPFAMVQPDADSYSGAGEYSTSIEVPMWPFAVMFLGFFVLVLAAAAMASAYVGGVLDIVDGKPVEIGTFFKPRNLGAVIVAALLVALASAVASVVPLGGAVVAVFTLFALIAVIDRRLSGVDGIKASFDLVKTRFGESILAWLVSNLIVVVGMLVCFVGVVVAAPVALLFQAYAWRRLTNGNIAALTP